MLLAGMLLVVLSAMPSGQASQARAGAVRRPDLSGMWQALNTANWDLQTHAPSAGPPQYGTLLTVPPGIGVVAGEEIPYLPEAAATRTRNREKRWTDDPEIRCFLPGVPRATYLPYPFQILQGADTVLFVYEYADAVRPVPLVKPAVDAPTDTWMGYSVGRWEGDTLVVDVTGFNDRTWFDRSGNFHSDALHVVERYTLAGPNQLNYEAQIEDPKVFSRPWTIRMPLFRHTEEGARLMEFKCAEFAEELIYGHLRKKPVR